jgi:hypothetical protein
MQLRSNIDQVVGQLERLVAKVPLAIDRALSAKLWEQPARDVAQRVLLVLAQPHERMFVDRYVNAITATVFGKDSGFSLTMTRPMFQSATLQSAQAARAATAANELGTGLYSLPIRQFEDFILQWVGRSEEEGGKRRDARDWGKSDEEIAHLISYIMLSPQVGSKGMAARNKLAPHIEKFLAQAQGPELSAATNNLWMTSILAAWREMVRFDFPLVLRRELKSNATA